MDLVRRRRWHRKMVQDDASAPAVFHIDVGSSKDDDVRSRNFVEFKVFVFGVEGKLRLLILFALLPHPPRFRYYNQLLQVIHFLTSVSNYTSVSNFLRIDFQLTFN